MIMTDVYSAIPCTAPLKAVALAGGFGSLESRNPSRCDGEVHEECRHSRKPADIIDM